MHQKDQNVKVITSNEPTIRDDFVFAAFSRAYTLTDYNVHKNLNSRYEFRRQTIYKDTTLTNDEKNEAIIILEKRYDYDKIIFSEGVRRQCEICREKYLAASYCEYCVRN